jgi:Flp pilus assembly pilin Flp
MCNLRRVKLRNFKFRGEIMSNKIKIFLKNETGAETLEYIVIAAVIIIAGAAAYQAAGINSLISGAFTKLTALIN